MRRKLMTTKEVLDLAATPGDGDGFECVEAARFLCANARSTHLFCFARETPVKGRRWFDHCVETCDAWETVSERSLLAEFDGVTWWVVDESQRREPPRV